jgi:hypothetical protein
MDKEVTDLRRIASVGSGDGTDAARVGVWTLEDLARRPADELAVITGKSERAAHTRAGKARSCAPAVGGIGPQHSDPVAKGGFCGSRPPPPPGPLAGSRTRVRNQISYYQSFAGSETVAAIG